MCLRLFKAFFARLREIPLLKFIRFYYSNLISYFILVIIAFIILTCFHTRELWNRVDAFVLNFKFLLLVYVDWIIRILRNRRLFFPLEHEGRNLWKIFQRKILILTYTTICHFCFCCFLFFSSYYKLNRNVGKRF